MALQQFAWAIAVMTILISKGGNSQHACATPPINSRIIGGQDASPGSWPWHVTFTTREGWVACQGSLITDEWVLTAAQCSHHYYLSGTTVHLGANNQSEFGEVTRRVDALVCHQDYYNYENDICLVKLSAPVDFTDYIRPVCLASANSTFYDGTSSWVTGFGTSGDHYYYYYRPDTLQEVDVPILGDNKCSCFYNNSDYYYNNLAITKNQMCAGSENGSKGPYDGDQGAALVTKHGSIWVQSGIASFVYHHYLDRPSIYTRVSQYEKWITAKVTGMEPGFVTFTSPGIDSDLNFTCPTPPPTTPHPTYYPYFTTHFPYFTTYYPHIYTDDSIFGSGETLIPITRFFPLSVLALLLHLFVGSAGM